MKKLLSAFALLTLCLCLPSPCAALQVADIFSDNMVLQRDLAAPVWGKAAAGTSVTVEFAGQSKTAVASADGTWRVALDPLSASAQPREMTVRATEAGKEQAVKFANVLVGEVWLCSGQSNMAMSLPELPDAREVIAAANVPQLRMLRVPEAPGEEPWTHVNAQWKVCSPQTAPSFSATSYFFARRLQEQLDVPVGLVLSAWGGSAACSWMSRSALNEPELRRQLPFDAAGWNVQVRPNTLYCGMLSPIVPLAVRGAIWYQGESDAEPPHNPYLYRRLLTAMIRDWRSAWGRELPFYLVQLPGLRSGKSWPVLRESQQAALQLPRTGMINTLDLSQSNNLHPTNKKQFAQRLADLVLAREYGKSITVDPPAYRSHKIDGATVRVEFDHAKGLRTADGQPPRCFALAGQDGKFAPATARIEGESVVLTSSVPAPVAVRYAWDADPKVNLVNGDALPALAFRTDDWPVAGQEMMWQTLPARASLENCSDADALIGGKSGWTWAGEGVETADLEKLRMVRFYGRGMAQLFTPNVALRRNAAPSPTLWWKRDLDVDPAKGVTAEMRVQLFQMTAPLTGLSLEVGVKQADGSLRCYRIAAAPMRLYGFGREQIFTLGRNLDNETAFHNYRISVRPDGTAQVYLDSQEMAALAGETLPAAQAKTSYVAFGKKSAGGLMTANLESVSLDTTGAYQP